MTDWIDFNVAERVNYTYDSLGQLKTAGTTGPAWGLSFSYDGFGNRYAQSLTKGSEPTFSVSISLATNRITTSGYGYDSNGNLTAQPGQTMAYDIQNRLKVATGTFGAERYGYDPGNKRVMKKMPGGSEEFYFYGAGGERLETFTLSGGIPTPLRSYVYFLGKLIRTIDHTTGIDKAVVTDRLDSVKVRAGYDGSGNLQVDNSRYYPFGEEQVPLPTTATSLRPITGTPLLGWITPTRGTIRIPLRGS